MILIEYNLTVLFLQCSSRFVWPLCQILWVGKPHMVSLSLNSFSGNFPSWSPNHVSVSVSAQQRMLISLLLLLTYCAIDDAIGICCGYRQMIARHQPLLSPLLIIQFCSSSSSILLSSSMWSCSPSLGWCCEIVVSARMRRERATGGEWTNCHFGHAE